jgi:hypothetical protein
MAYTIKVNGIDHSIERFVRTIDELHDIHLGDATELIEPLSYEKRGYFGRRNSFTGIGWTDPQQSSPLRASAGAKRRLERRTRSSRGKCLPEHGQAANGRFLGRFVLDDVPVFGKLAVLEAHDIHHDPVCR